MSGLGNESADQHLLEHEHTYLETIADEFSSGGAVPATHALLTGKVVAMNWAGASDVTADLIVMTSHGPTGLSRTWLGNVADGLIRHTDVPVLILRPQSRKCVFRSCRSLISAQSDH